MESASEIFSQQNMHMPHMHIPIVIMVVLASAVKYLMFVRLLSSKVLSDYVGILSQEKRCVNRVFEKIVKKHKNISKNREKTQKYRMRLNPALGKRKSRYFHICLLWWIIRGSTASFALLAGYLLSCHRAAFGTLATRMFTGHSRLRSRPRGFEPCVKRKKKQILSYLLTLVDHQGFEPWTP